jgi:hypothetical protein
VKLNNSLSRLEQQLPDPGCLPFRDRRGQLLVAETKRLEIDQEKRPGISGQDGPTHTPGDRNGGATSRRSKFGSAASFANWNRQTFELPNHDPV